MAIPGDEAVLCRVNPQFKRYLIDRAAAELCSVGDALVKLAAAQAGWEEKDAVMAKKTPGRTPKKPRKGNL